MTEHVVIIGAGIGGLACAMRLSAAGLAVTVLERHGHVGGKMRTVRSEAGPIDAGPTVFTMRPIFEQLFADTGARLTDHITLRKAEVIARHWWADGTTLDLVPDREASARNIRDFAGAKAEREWRAFAQQAALLFETFDAPMMKSAAPSALKIAAQVAATPSVIMAMAPWATLSGRLGRQFSDPRLAQLYGRYATYVGGSPLASPALLALVAEAEARGVWSVDGGMHRLAEAMADRAHARGAQIKLRTHVKRIEQQDGRVVAVHTADGRIAADRVVFNGDPRALTLGLLGKFLTKAVERNGVEPRSLSARVAAFAARAQGPRAAELAHHNVFFGQHPRAEFEALARGEMPTDPTIYVCAQDRSGGGVPDGQERFEIILNAAPSDAETPAKNEAQTCQMLLKQILERFGLRFDPIPAPRNVTLPSGFNALFPATAGSLYGRSPHGMMAAFARPLARTRIPGLYLVGGGTHPGAGIPMAALSGQHGAAAILQDRASTSRSRQMAMHGGTSTA
ncbi:MAG: 1-hydroxycarotenoid 3,4-desaturase CrtD [Pseudomonadota bacterium]